MLVYHIEENNLLSQSINQTSNKYKVRNDVTISVSVNEEDIRTLVVEIKSPTKTNNKTL